MGTCAWSVARMQLIETTPTTAPREAKRILIDEIGLHLKRSVRRYGKRKVYYFENIKNLSFFIPEEGSIQSVWESSPWINGAERFSFEYFGKMIKFGNKLTQKEAQLLSQVIEKRMRKLAKK